MGSNLSVYNLGSLGVNVDKSPIHIEDGELTNAQNATKDPLGIVGGIVKRLGLAKFNNVAGAGSIQGGIGVPLFNQTTGTRTFYYARFTGSTSLGWRTSTNGWTTGASISSGSPANPQSETRSPGAYYLDGSYSYSFGHPGCIFSNRLVYAADNYTHNVTAPPIRIFDGVIDKPIAILPNNPDVSGGVQSFGTITMIAVNGIVYLTTLDGGSDDTNFKGSVYQLNPSTGVLIKIGATIAAGEVPYALTYAFGKLWLGTLHSLDATVAGKVYFIRPGVDTTWTLDHTLTGNQSGVTALLPYNGELYASCIAALGTAGTVVKRTALGIWSTVETGTQTDKTNGYQCLVQFGANLYTAYHNKFPATSFVRKFNGTTWSTVFSPAGSLSLNNSYVNNGVLYLSVGYSGLSGGSNSLVSTTNGTSWTDLSSALANTYGGVFGVVTT